MAFKDREFELFGTKYSLKYVDKIPLETEDIFISGLTNSAAGTVEIARLDYNKNPVNKDTCKIVLLHELIHAKLNEGQYRHASGDEPMVEWLARCLKSLIDLKVI